MNVTPLSYPPELAVGLTSDRITTASLEARAVHRVILSGFATTGQAPDQAALARILPAGPDVAAALAELHERDVIRLDEHTAIRAAYPFSFVPTAHLVAIDGGPTVYAMCAIDALGIADMTGRDIAITSADPETGEPIDVSVTNGHTTWRPDTAVVYVGSTTPAMPVDCCPPIEVGDVCVAPAAERSCTVMNFFASPDTATAWQARHPDVSGVVLSQDQALRLGADIFGPLLSTPEA